MKLRAFLRSNHKISQMQVRVRPTTMYRSVCSFSVRSDRLARRLLELGRYQGPVDPGLVGSRHFWRGVVDGDGSIGCYSGRWQFRLCGQARLLMPFTQFLVARNMSRLSVRPHKSITALGTTGRPAERIIDLLYHGAGQAVLDRKAATAARVIDRLNNLVGE